MPVEAWPDLLQVTPCRACQSTDRAEEAAIRGNTRAYAAETFLMFACAGCGALNTAAQHGDAELYAAYPLHAPPRGLTALAFALAHGKRARRLKAAGVKPPARVLDFGAGHGGFARRLRAMGYAAEAFEPAQDLMPMGAFQAITCQDVIEHVENPGALLQTLSSLLDSRGVLLLGAPLADGITLTPAFAMHLHQPYHRCLLSEAALNRLAREAGLKVARLERRFAGTGPWPGLHPLLIERLAAATDGTLEATLRPPLRALLRPRVVAAAVFGGVRPDGSNMSAVLKKV